MANEEDWQAVWDGLDNQPYSEIVKDQAVAAFERIKAADQLGITEEEIDAIGFAAGYLKGMKLAGFPKILSDLHERLSAAYLNTRPEGKR